MKRNNIFDKLISVYESERIKSDKNSFIEVEIRIKNISKTLIKEIYNKMMTWDNKTLETTINIINGENIHRILFQGDSKTKSWSKKTKLYSLKQSNPTEYSINISRESSSEVFPLPLSSIIRFKSRFSSNKDSKWRFDLTAVKEDIFNNVKQNIEKIKSKMFDGLTIENFLREDSTYELEIEWIGSGELDLRILEELNTLFNSKTINSIDFIEETKHIAKYLGSNKTELKQVLNAAKSLTKNLYYEIYPPLGWYIVDKTEGQRCVISVDGNKCILLVSNNLILASAGPYTEGAITMADSEIIDKSIYIFDVCVYKDLNISNDPFSSRMEYFQQTATLLTKLLPEYKVKVKDYHLISDLDALEKTIKSVVEKKYEYQTDGLIFTEPDKSYSQTRNYKWKPLELSTIDFLARACPSELLGKYPFVAGPGEKVYLLFVGISHTMKESFCIKPLSVYKKLFPNITSGYYPIQFSPSMNPYAYVFYSTDDTLDNKVVELRLIDSKWDLLRVREDRKSEIGQYNDFRIAELTYINYFDLFPLSDLWKPNTSYFNKQTFDIWTAGNNYKRYIIGTVIAKYLTNAKWVIDEAAGRGADLFRYMNVGVANLLCLDNDVSAISELLRRKFEPRQQQQSKCTNVMTAVVDLTSKKEIIKQSIITFSPPLVDAIVCNFALHYMCGNASHIKNLLEVNYEILAKGGLFIFSVMDGQKVFNELMNGDYEIFQDDVLKYCIKKKYTTDKLGLYGQKIEVLLPFSTNMYEESLVNIDNIIKLSSNIGFELVERRSFVDFPQNKYLYDRLSEDDIHYIGLHSMVVLKKL